MRAIRVAFLALALTAGVSVAALAQGHLNQPTPMLPTGANAAAPGTGNTALGIGALNPGVSTGGDNTASGFQALGSNTTGGDNTASGFDALVSNTIGYQNAANGFQALYGNTTGANNIASGYQAGRYIAGGATANQTSINSVYLGAGTEAKADGDVNEGVYGYNAVGNGSNTNTFGNSSTVGNYFYGARIMLGSVPTPTGTCAINNQVGGNTAGSFKANGACAAGTVILTFAATAPNGYVCSAHDMTTPADAMNQTAYSTTSCTLTGTMASADQVTFSATGF